LDSNLYARVYALLATVPAGHVVSYGELARGLGMPRGARVVGWAMRTCPEGLPWHRVVNARGEISQRGIGEGEALQRVLLEDEGVDFRLGGRIDMQTYGWRFDIRATTEMEPS
jgi:methylated-DNA-protein-cysteine methyltransferase-like protein